MEKGALETGEKLGLEMIVKTPSSEHDIAMQVQLLAALGALGIDAIVVAPSSKDALIAPLNALAAKGVKVVILDSSLGDTCPGVFVGTDQRAAGIEAARFIGSLIADGDEVSLFKHTQTSVATAQRELGAVEKFRATHPTSVIHGDIYAGTDEGEEGVRAAFLLKKHPKTKGIIATNTAGSLAMAEVLKRPENKGKFQFAGFGYNLTAEAAAAIKEGAMQGWVAQLPHQVGRQGVEAAAALIKGEKLPPSIYVPFVLVTKDNLNDPEVQALLLQQ